MASGAPCQDACTLLLCGDASCLLVADGAGSAEHSDVGSRVAVESAAQFLGDCLAFWRPCGRDDWATLLRCTVGVARDALQGLAREGVPLDHAATTLLVVVASAEQASAAAIGDCAAVVADTSDRLLLLAAPDNGEYINETYFLTGAEWQTRLHITHVQAQVRYVAAFSDGLQFVALHRGQPFAGFLDRVVSQLGEVRADRRPASLESYLATHIAGKRTDDDITLAAAWRHGDTQDAVL